ncbi:MAG TPA: AMP-binding protein, partial [Gemmatimonadales bacterium]|nr:AMP-binding protein [Gemmatimonadales bacterium]
MEGRPKSLPEWNPESGDDGLRDSLPDWVAHQANVNPDRIALIAGDGEYSYGQLNSEVSATARKLASFGVAAGDRVATCLQNGACSAILPHAILRLGATLVPLNYRLSASELRGQLITVDARMLLVDRHSASRFAGSQDATEEPLLNEAEGMNRLPGANVGLPTVATAMAAADRDAAVSFGIPALEDATEADVPLRVRHDSGHILAIIHTSGTTGVARGAMLSVGNFWWSAIGSALNMGTQPDDRWLATLPLFHVGGLSILTRAAIYGIAAEIHDGFDAARVNAAIDTGRASIVSVVAVMLKRMLDERANKPYPPSLRCVLLGGGPAPLPLLERCSRA